MSVETRFKVKAFMLITMLALTEGHGGIQQMVDGSATSSHDTEATLCEIGRALRGRTWNWILPQIHHGWAQLIEHSWSVVKQMKVLAGPTEKDVFLGKPPKTAEWERAIEMTRDLSKHQDEPSVDLMLSEQMEEIFADPHVHEQAQAFTQDLQTAAELQSEGTTYSHSKLDRSISDVKTQQTATRFAQRLHEVASDPKFKKHQKQVSNVVESLKQDADLQRRVQSLASNVDFLKDPTKDSAYKIRQVSEHIVSRLANAKFPGMVSEGVFEVLVDDFESTLVACMEGLDVEHLVTIVESPQLLESILEPNKPKKTSQRSLLEVPRASGHDIAFAPLVQFPAVQRQQQHTRSQKLSNMRPQAVRNTQVGKTFVQKTQNVRRSRDISLSAVPDGDILLSVLPEGYVPSPMDQDVLNGQLGVLGAVAMTVGVWWFVVVPNARVNLAVNKNQGKLKTYLQEIKNDPSKKLERWFFDEWLSKIDPETKFLLREDGANQTSLSLSDTEGGGSKTNDDDLKTIIARARKTPAFFSFDNPVLTGTLIAVGGAALSEAFGKLAER